MNNTRLIVSDIPSEIDPLKYLEREELERHLYHELDLCPFIQFETCDLYAIEKSGRIYLSVFKVLMTIKYPDGESRDLDLYYGIESTGSGKLKDFQPALSPVSNKEIISYKWDYF